MKKSKLGGKRPGAGRPKGEKKKALGLRVPEKHHKHLVELVQKELLKLNGVWHVTNALSLKPGKPESNSFYFKGSKEACENYIDSAMLAAHG